MLGFLEDISNVPKWDRGVSAVRLTSLGPLRIGSEFDTLPYPRRPGDGLEWGRMSYRVTEWDRAGRYGAVQLISKTGNARFFRTAAWLTRVETVPEGSRVFLGGRLYAAASLRVHGANSLRRQARHSCRSRGLETRRAEFVGAVVVLEKVEPC